MNAMAWIDVVLDALCVIPAAVLGIVAVPRTRGRLSAAHVHLLSWALGLGCVAAVLIEASVLVTEALNVPALSQLSAFRLVRLALVLSSSAAAVAALRGSTWRVDRALVAVILAAGVGAAYVVAVVRVDSVFGLDTDWLAPPQVAAAGLVAIAFEPVRSRLQRLADRAVHGRRLTQSEVLARVSALSRASAVDAESFRELARIVAQTLGTSGAAIHVRAADGSEQVHRWPPLGQAPAREHRIPVVVGGGTAGALAIPDDGPPADRRHQALLDDLCRAVGVLLRNAVLASELQESVASAAARSAQIRASRWRIVTAQDSERRELERDLHDVAQPGLTAVRLTLGLANHLAAAGGDACHRALVTLRSQIALADAGLRQTLQGIEPPALTDQGIVAALRATAETLHLDTEFRVGDAVLGARFAHHLETAVYFCCAEALQNTAKHCPGATAVVELGLADARLRFVISDNGPGYEPSAVAPGSGLQNMADRMAAVGGDLAVTSVLGRGTTFIGSIPV
jgi:signal transduction histidine kinase